jgi:hypothetical protein
MRQEELNKVTARVILSTKRKSRQYNLIEVASDIQTLKTSLGNLNEVAKVIGISPGMLNQFLSVFKLPKKVLKLVEERKIDSVAIVHFLTKYSNEDNIQLADLIVSNKLSSQDLKVLLPYRKQFPNEKIVDLVEKLHRSKNVKVSVIRLSEDETSKSFNELNDLFSAQVGVENIIEIEKNTKNIDIKLSKKGEKILRETAKKNKLTLQKYVFKLIN